jgi:prepilin-type N-terminal cleavage/methylation domain-containing protein
MKSKGFTLIELLVVIAIIGILSSVVLASLNTARNKGSEAAIKANLANIRPQAEIIYDAQGCYGDNDGGTTCAAFTKATCSNATDNTLFKDTTVWGQISAAKSASGSSALTSCESVTTSGGAWAVAVQRKDDTTEAWCVDSTGQAKTEDLTASPSQALINAVITSAKCN